MPPWLTHPPTTVKRDCLFSHPTLPLKEGQRPRLFAPALWVWDVGCGPGNASLTWRQNHGSDHTLRISSSGPGCFAGFLIHLNSCSTQTRSFPVPLPIPPFPVPLSTPPTRFTLPVHHLIQHLQDSEAGPRRALPTEEGAGHPKKPFQHLRRRGEL